MTSNTSKPMTEREAGRVALKELLTPISVRLLVGRTLAALGGVLAIAPYIALVKLGAVFYQAYSTGTEVDTVRVTTIVNIRCAARVHRHCFGRDAFCRCEIRGTRA